ncbi:hypothetical protein [Thermomonospora umbrina]|uniref:Uncharacterized protein n=1 Tax=Thermomonospora umbrina TaxID=111806 RepID=A0A3D9T4S5_9ACTN|nr:hypothetical protein [Thermomonospora umbrina]REF00246.1 hypothetical protein DFJ69_5774 [Thermomonospora umbrina]
MAAETGAARPTPECLNALCRMAASIYERLGDNWQIVYDPEYDDEVSVRTEGSTANSFSEVFSTYQVDAEDPLEVAGLLMSAPALMAEVDALRSGLTALLAEWEQHLAWKPDGASAFDPVEQRKAAVYADHITQVRSLLNGADHG